MRAGIVTEDPAHQATRQREEVGPAFQLQVLLLDQPKIDLMDYGSRLKGVTRTLRLHVMMRQATELLINQRDELGFSLTVAATYLCK
jgi:hypothetical protein